MSCTVPAALLWMPMVPVPSVARQILAWHFNVDRKVMT